MDGSAEVLAEAIGSPDSLRFARSGVVDVVVDAALARLVAINAGRLCRVGAATRLVWDWREQLAEVEAILAGGDHAVGETWLGVAGSALAVSAVAGAEGDWPATPVDRDVLRGAVFCHASGVLFRRDELGRLWRDAVGDLESRRASVAELISAAQAAIAGELPAGEEPWLWLAVEEAAAKAAAAAAVVALEIA